MYFESLYASSEKMSTKGGNLVQRGAGCRELSLYAYSYLFFSQNEEPFWLNSIFNLSNAVTTPKLNPSPLLGFSGFF
jgi:hypothetical protein